MKATRKTIQIDIEYFDRSELGKIFDSILEQVTAGKTNHFESKDAERVYAWSLQFDVTNDFREEQINGVWCRIYKSRLNE